MILVTGFTQDWNDFSPIAEDKLRYCNKHGYGFCCFREFDTSRHPTWSKIKFVEAALGSTDWVFWSDADAILKNHDLKLESFLSPADFICSRDNNGINDGNFFLRNCDWSVDFLKEIWSNPKTVNPSWCEQGVIMALQSDYENHYEVLPQDRLCSYPDTYKDGDFVLHFAAWHKEGLRANLHYWMNL